MSDPAPPAAPPAPLVPGDGLSHALFTQSPLSTVVYDAAGHVTTANAAFERLFGVRAADLPRDYTILEDPQLAAQGLLDEVRRAFAGASVALPPVRYQAAADLGVTTSTWTQAYLYPLRDPSGAVTAVVLVHLDLTARVGAEEALRASEARLRLAFEAGRMGAWEWVLADGRVRWSEALERMHGLEPGTFAGTFEAYQVDIHPQDRDAVAGAIERTLAGQPHELAYRIVRPDGEVRWLSARGQLVRDADGNPERVVGVCADVTDARRAEEGTRLLAEAGAALAASLDYEGTLATVARVAVPALADFCVIDLVDAAAPGGMRGAAGAHVDATRERLLAALRPFPPLLASDGIAARAVRAAAPQLLSPATDADLAAAAAGRAEPLALLRALGPEALLCVPLVARGSVIGTMLLASAGSRRRYGPDDLPVATELARRAAVAVDNARLHAEALAAHAASERQAVELELQAGQLQEQASELEAQQLELTQQVADAAALTGELRETNAALERARDAAERSAREVQGILASISDPFVVYDADWRLRYVNGPARAVFRATASAHGEDGPLGASVWDLYPDLRGTRLERAMRRAAEERAPATFEELRPQTGAWTEVRCYPLPDGGLAVSWRDVTERRRAAEAEHYLGEATAILASSLDYEATLASLARLVVPRLADWCAVDLVAEGGGFERVAVAHVDPQKVQWARELHRRYPPNPDAPTGVAQVVRTGRPELVPEITDEMLAASVSDPEYLALLRGLGMRSALLVPLPGDGRPLGVLTLIAAESGRRYGEADLQLARELARRAALAVDNARLHRASEAARAQAEAANRSKAEFLASMSHELRTPLNAIGGYTDLLLLGVRGALTPEQREDLERVARSQRHLLGVINDILNFARVDAGFVDYDLRPVAVARLMAEVEPLVRPQLAARGLTFACDAGPEALRAHADAEKVRQVLLNLLANAVKFTEPGGRVWLGAEDLGDAVALRVRDTGIGIPADRQAAVFEPFVQVHRSLTRPVEGTGLGLAISRDLARGMGGDLTVDSVVGTGSTFTLTLPRA